MKNQIRSKKSIKNKYINHKNTQNTKNLFSPSGAFRFLFLAMSSKYAQMAHEAYKPFKISLMRSNGPSRPIHGEDDAAIKNSF